MRDGERKMSAVFSHHGCRDSYNLGMDQRKRGRTSDSLVPAPSSHAFCDWWWRFRLRPCRGIAKKFCLTGTSSMMAEGATFPVDITKTRLQLQGQASENPVTHEPQQQRILVA